MAARTRTRSGTAVHRPARRQRRFRHDTLTAVDLFSGFGGLTDAARRAGFDTIMAANHNSYKVEVHEANHPEAEHWIADLVDPEAADYHSARDLPPADFLLAGVSCVNHSRANSVRAYAQGLSLFELDDPEFEQRVTRSERDRATANCVLHYAEQHRPRLILVECTTELTSWGPALPGKRKVGDGSTFRWWLRQFENLGYRYRILYLNASFFGVGQSRNRLFIPMWNRALPEPDLEHCPLSWCGRCEAAVNGAWTWKTGVPPTGAVSHGLQYCYRCPTCRAEVLPPTTPALHALDLSDLGTLIGDRPLKQFVDRTTGETVWSPLAPPTMARAERCRQRFAEFPAVVMPAKAAWGSERHLWQPLATQTGQQETAVLSTGTPALTGQVMAAHRHNGDGKHITQPMDTVTSTHELALLLAVTNFQGGPRGVHEPLPTQVGSETLGLLSAGIVPFRRNTVPTTNAEPMPTMAAGQIPGLITAAGTIKNNGSIAEAKYRAHPVSDPFGTMVASAASQALLFSGWNQLSPGSEATAAAWRAALADIALEDCHFRMMQPHEIGRGCGFDTTFPGRPGTFVVWGSARDQTDGFGNAVPPQIGEWIGSRLRDIVDTPEAVA